MIEIPLSKFPHPVIIYKDAALSMRKSGLRDGDTLPHVQATMKDVSIDAKHLARYRRVCGFGDGEMLPLSYPHVLAAPLHMAVLTHEEMPLQLLGLVHIRNVIQRHRHIRADEKLQIAVTVNGHREVEKGFEFDIVTEIHSGDELVWNSISTNLRRVAGKGESGAKKKPSSAAVEDNDSASFSSWEATSGIGRAYALASGDFNPIHLTALTAKALGFKKAIAHGMWSLARTAAELDDDITPKCTYTVDFKLPVFLPAWVRLRYERGDAGIELKLTSSDGSKPHMVGTIENHG